MACVFVAHCHVAHNPNREHNGIDGRKDNGTDDSFVLHPLETDTIDKLMTMAVREILNKYGREFSPLRTVSLYCYSDSGERHPRRGSLRRSATVGELRVYVQQLKPNDKECHVHIDMEQYSQNFYS